MKYYTDVDKNLWATYVGRACTHALKDETGLEGGDQKGMRFNSGELKRRDRSNKYKFAEHFSRPGKRKST